MPSTKAKIWKTTKANELWNKYYNNKCQLPNYKRKRDQSPNATINRKVLKKEMESRGMGQDNKPRTSGEVDGEDIAIKYKAKNQEQYEKEKKLFLEMNAKERRKILKAEARAKWEKEHAHMSEAEIKEMERLKQIEKDKAREQEKKKKLEDVLKQQEEVKRKLGEERKKKEEERKQSEEKRRREEKEQREQKEQENKRREEEARFREERRRWYEQQNFEDSTLQEFDLAGLKSSVEELGLSGQFDLRELRQKYKMLALKNHPDKQGDTEVFKRIQVAYDQLVKYFELTKNRTFIF